MDESESKSKVLAHGGVTSVVRIDDSRVILPAGREISSDLVAQELLVKQIMPSDVSGEVLKLLQSEKAGMSRLQVLLTVSLLILVGWFAWYFFPFQKVAKPIDDGGIEIVEEDPVRGDPLKVLAVTAERLYKERKYKACSDALLPKLQELLAGVQEGKEGYNRMLWVFCDCARLGSVSRESLNWAKQVSIQMSKSRGDDEEWEFMTIDLCADEYLKYNSLHEKICNGAVRDNVSYHLEQVKGNIVRLKTLRDKLELRLKRIGGDEYLEKQLVACEHSLARLYVSRWMLEGGRGRAKFPDDSLEKPGVWSREEALRIAKKYPSQKEFLEIRRFIALTMLNQSKMMNRYYWNGETYWSNDALRNEFSEVDGKLQKAAMR